MGSDLKPRTKSKKTANYKLYVVLSCLVLLVYFFGFHGSSAKEIIRKYDSASSAITNGISGTPKDKTKTEKSPAVADQPGGNTASRADEETHALVHELKKQAEGELPGSGSITASEITVKSGASSATAKGQGKSREGGVYDAADSLGVLLESYPMIVFSKSYCPHSKKAKSILDFYDIRPRPLIFELDVEEHGAELQAELAKLTGRKTVPNVMVNAQSIGGGDEIVGLDQSDKLISKVRELSDRIDITRKAKSGRA